MTEGTAFATKPALAVQMIERAIAADMPFAWVAADAVYGVGDIEQVLRRAGKGYVLRYGYFRIYILLRREGWFVNHKRVYRLYREDGLSLRLRLPRRNVSAANRERQPAASAANEM